METRDPYRDDRASLVAENERLRGENRAFRTARRRAIIAKVVAPLLAVADVTAMVMLPPFFNADADGRVYLGVFIALALVALNIVGIQHIVASTRGARDP